MGGDESGRVVPSIRLGSLALFAALTLIFSISGVEGAGAKNPKNEQAAERSSPEKHHAKTPRPKDGSPKDGSPKDGSPKDEPPSDGRGEADAEPGESSLSSEGEGGPTVQVPAMPGSSGSTTGPGGVGALAKGPDEAGQTSGDGVTPTLVQGNPSCANINSSWNELRINGSATGDHADLDPGGDNPGGVGPLTVRATFSDTPEDGSLTWSSNMGVDAVIVKGGSTADLYYYSREDTGDSGLTSPFNGANQKYYGISHVSFCYGAVLPALALSTTPDPTAGTVGDTLHATVTLTGGQSPTGAITFQLFDPTDPDCSGIPAFTETVTVDGNGEYATTTGHVAVAAGTWRWAAHYSGDARNDPASSGCGEGEVVISAVLAAPLLVVDKTNDANGDGEFTDTETGIPGDLVDFKLFISNPGVVPIVLDSIVDELPGFSVDVCGSLLGTVLHPGDNVGCTFTMLDYVPGPGDSLQNTVTVTGHEENSPESLGRDVDGSTVRSVLVLGRLFAAGEEGSRERGGDLAATGFGLLPTVLLGSTLLGAGGLLLVWGRRRTRRARHPA